MIVMHLGPDFAAAMDISTSRIFESLAEVAPPPTSGHVGFLFQDRFHRGSLSVLQCQDLFWGAHRSWPGLGLAAPRWTLGAQVRRLLFEARPLATKCSQNARRWKNSCCILGE